MTSEKLSTILQIKFSPPLIEDPVREDLEPVKEGFHELTNKSTVLVGDDYQKMLKTIVKKHKKLVSPSFGKPAMDWPRRNWCKEWKSV